jgi:hypothetical protein
MTTVSPAAYTSLDGQIAGTSSAWDNNATADVETITKTTSTEISRTRLLLTIPTFLFALLSLVDILFTSPLERR